MSLHIAILSLFPFLIRGLVMAFYHRVVQRPLEDEEGDSDAHRSYIYCLIAISFAGLVGLTVVDASVDIKISDSAVLLMVAFVSYYLSLNMQTYKLKLYLDIISDGLLEVGSFALFMSIVVLVGRVKQDTSMITAIQCILVMAWAVDYLVKIIMLVRYLQTEKESLNGRGP